MYQQSGSTHTFRASWTGRNLARLASAIVGCGALCVAFFGVIFQLHGFELQRTEDKIILPLGFVMLILVMIFAFRLIIMPAAKKGIVLQTDPQGVSSDYLRNAIIGWPDLLDMKVAIPGYVSRIGGFSMYAGMSSGRTISGRPEFPKNLKITLILRENSPSWLAMPRKWIFWRSSSFDILLDALPPSEQVQAALALRAAFARYGGEVAYRLMQGIRKNQMADAFEELARWTDLPETLSHPDFTLPPRDAPDAKP